MGRWSTGAITTNEALRIELSYLLKNGYIKKGQNISGTLTWTNDSNIGFESLYNNDNLFIRLYYTFTNNRTGEVTNYDYKIHLTTVPSNLGNGDVLYFICPQTARKCRILYKCYGSPIWKSRNAYQHRIYYKTQICSKLYYYTERYFNLEKQFKNLKKPVKSHYRGKVTRTAINYQRIEGLKNKFDILRWQTFEDLMSKKYPFYRI